MLNPPAFASRPVRPDEDARALQRAVLVLALLYAAFVVYGSLVPLQPVPLALQEAWRRFVGTTWVSAGHLSRTDLAVNLMLTVPLALLLRECVHRPGAGALGQAWRHAAVWLACAVLSVGVEFLQVFFPQRSHALSDVAAQWLGAALGLVLHAWRGARLRAWALGWWTLQQGRPMALWLLRGWLLALLAAALVPLDLTISPVEVYHKWREGRVHLMPFADLPPSPMLAAWELASDALLWAPVGVLWRLQGRSLAWAALGGLLAALAIEVLQLLVYSRVTASTDVLVGAVGCLLGAAAVPAAMGRGDGSAAALVEAPGARAGAACLFGLATWAAFVLLAYWYPYRMDWSADPLRARLLEALTRWPFEALFFSTEQRAVTELLRKPLMFLPGGMLWALWQARRGLVRPRVGPWLLVAACLALLVEAGQLAMPAKVADLTDMGLGVLGAWLGWLAGRRLRTAAGAPGGVLAGAARAAHDKGSALSVGAPIAAEVPSRAAVAVPPAPWAVFGVGCLGFACFIAWRGLAGAPAAGPGVVGASLVWVWVALAALPALAPRWPWVGLAAFMLALWVTPRYGADMQWMLQLPLLPGLALAAAVGWWWAARLRSKVSRLALAPDGLFVLFLGWVLLLAAWHAGTGTALAIEPLYHPVTYLYAAALYLAARTDPMSVAEQRHMAMALLAGVLAATGLHIGLDRFHLNGHIAFLMAMAVPLAWALQRSAAGPIERAAWWLALGLLVAGVVVNQNRSAVLGLVALALVAMAPTRIRWWLGGMLLVVLAVFGLGWLGLLDRFASVIEPRWARQFDAMAEATVSSRFALWRASWEMLATAPLAGVGPGQFEAALARLSPSTENVPAHNTWLTLACETGAIGVVLAALAFMLAGLGGGAAPARPGAAVQPNWSPQTIARQGLLVWLVFGMFNSRPDFVWAYFLAGWAVAWPPAARRHSNNRSAFDR